MSEYKSPFVYDQSLYERLVADYGEDVFTSENTILTQDQKSIFENRRKALANPKDTSVRLSIDDLDWLNDSELDFVVETNRNHLSGYDVNSMIEYLLRMSKGARGRIYINCLKRYYDSLASNKDFQQTLIFNLIKNEASIFLIRTFPIPDFHVLRKKFLLLENLYKKYTASNVEETHKICDYLFSNNTLNTEEDELDGNSEKTCLCVRQIYSSTVTKIKITTQELLFLDWICSLLHPLPEDLINIIPSRNWDINLCLNEIILKYCGMTDNQFYTTHRQFPQRKSIIAIGIAPTIAENIRFMDY